MEGGGGGGGGISCGGVGSISFLQEYIEPKANQMTIIDATLK